MEDTRGTRRRVLGQSVYTPPFCEHVSLSLRQYRSMLVVQFFFYPATVLERVFNTFSPASAEAGCKAAWLMQELAAHRLDAVEAYDSHKAGTIIGNTVALRALL